MNFINTISAQRFSLDGIDYFKNFLSKVNGNNITVYNAYDSNNVLVEAKIFSQITLNGIVHASVGALQNALLPIIYTRNSLNGLVTQSSLFNYFSNITGFTLLGQNLTINAGWAWFIEGSPYTNSANVVFNIPFAVAGKKRIDIVVANVNNTFQLIQGIEVLVANTPAEPIIPIGTIKTTTLIVNDSTGGISNPVAPTPGSGTGSGIVDAPAIPGTGTTIMTFDEIRYHGPTNQIGNMALVLNATPGINKNGRVQVYDVNGTPPFTFTHPVQSTSANGVAFDNAKNNVIYYDNINGKLKHSITLQNKPDVVAPTLISAIIQKANPSNIVITYNEALTVFPLPANSDYGLNLSKNVTNVAISGNVITLTVNSPYVSGNLPTISYTSGVNKIKDLAGNIAANLVGQVVTNNVGFLVSDNFTSANITNISGRITPIGGFTWLKAGAGIGTLGIVNNSLKNTGAVLDVDNIYFINIASRNVDVSLTFKAVGTPGYSNLEFARTNDTNRYYLRSDMQLRKVVGDVNTLVSAIAGGLANGDVVRCVLTNSVIEVYKNGIQVYTGASDSSITGTNVGIYVYQDDVVDFDNFNIE